MGTSQTALDWQSVAMNQTTKHSQTVFNHSHHTNLSRPEISLNVLPTDGTVKITQWDKVYLHKCNYFD